MKRIYGFLLVVASAAGFGAMPIFARYAYAAGIDPVSLLFFRFLIAAICMGAILFFKKSALPTGRSFLVLVLMGMLGYAGQSFSYFTALTLIPASLVAILLYLYPVLVTILSTLLFKEPLSAGKLLALVMAMGGTVLVIGLQTGSALPGIAWGLCAALIYSGYIIIGSRVMRVAEPLAGSTVVIAAAALALGGVAYARGLVVPQTMVGWVSVVFIAVCSTAVAIATFFYGLKYIGPVDASLISTFEPVTTIILASALLGEHITALQVVGIVLILSAVIVLARQRAA
jgi:drug/metabolite transporter (DMT)-like permease